MTPSDFTADQALSALRTPSRGGPPPPPLEQAAFDAAHAAIRRANTAETALDAVEATWAVADDLWDGLRANPTFVLATPPAACKKGCGWCCHQRVGAAAIEVLTMARALAGRPEARWRTVGSRGRLAPSSRTAPAPSTTSGR